MGKTKMKVIVAFIAVIAVSLLAVCFGHLFSYSEAKAADGATYDDSAAVALLQDIADDGNATLTQDVVIDLTVSSRITDTLGLNGYMDIDDDTTIKLGGHTLKIVTGSTNCCVEVAEGKTLEIKGSGSFIGESGGDFAWGQEGSSISISATATVDFTYNEDAPGSGGTEVDVPTDDEKGTYLVRSEGTVTFIKNWSGTTTTLVSNIPVAVKTGDCVTDYGTIRVNEDKIYSNSLSAAVLATDSDDDTVYLLNDVTGSIGNQTAAAELLNGLTIDLQGNTLKSANGNAPTMRITTSGDLTIKNGKINPSANAMFDITAAKNAEINVNISNIIAVNGSGEEHAEITGSTPPVYSVKFDGSESDAMNVVVDGLKVDLAVPNAQHSAGVISAYGVDSLKITDSSLSIGRTPESGVTGTEIAVYSNASNVSITRSELSSETGAGIIFLGDMMADAATNAISDTSGYYTLDFSDSSVTGGTFGISGNGSNSEDQHYSGTVINVKDSTVKGGAAAPGIYQPQVGILNVSGTSKISGSSGIEIRAGKLNVEDGEIIATSTELTTADKPGEGSSIDGAAIAISQHSTDQPIEVTISDGTFIGPAAVYEKDLLNETGNDDIAADLFGGTYKGDIESENMPGFISGGEFDGMLSKDYLSEGSAFYLDEKGNIKVADENSAPEGFDKVVATIGDKGYGNLQGAIDAAVAGDTVKLYDDVTESVTVAKDDTITLDLNGNTITNAAGQHTITNNGTLTIVGTGTVDNVSHARGAIVNYGEAYLNGGTFTRSAEKGTYGDDSISGTYSANGNSWYTVKNYGYMRINGAAVTTNTSGTVVIGSVPYPTGGYSSLIANGYQNAADYNSNHSLVTGKEATLDIVNGTFSGGINTVKNDEHSVLSISGGTLANTTQHTVLNYGVAKISGGVFNAPTASAAVWTEYYDDNTPGTLTVTGGDLNGGQYGIVVRKGAQAEISGNAEVSGEYAVIVNEKGSSAKVSGGNFEGAFSGQYADTLSVSGGTFKSLVNEAYIADASIMYSDGDGYVVGNYDTVIQNPPATVKYVIGNIGYSTIEEAMEAGAVAVIENTDGVSYAFTSLAEAVNGASAGDVIKLVADTEETAFTIDKENITIDIAGFNVTTDGMISINADGITVTDSTAADGTRGGTVSGSTSIFSVNEALGVTIENINIKTTSDDADIRINTDHVNMTSADKTGLTLKNVYIEGNNGIYVFTFNKSVANDGNTYVELNIVDSEIISAQYYGIAGNGVNHGTVINVVDSDITVNGDSGLGIYHPQCGVLTISGNSYIKAANGIEMRAGTLNIADAGVTVESTATEFSTTPNGNGTTLSGVAVGISQHTTNLPVAVNISGGTYIAAENCYALYEVDLQDTDYTGISVSINGGTFEGAVKSEDLTGFIHSGKFAVAPDADAFAEGYGGVLYNGYYVVAKEGTTTEEIAGNITSAKSEVRVYAAIYGLTMSKIEALADAGDADAMAIVTAYAAIEERPTDTAEALAAVLDAIDAYVTNLEAYKEEAIAELQACAELNNVASPTATYASIRNAKTKAEVDEYMEYAFYEIVYLTHLRSDVMTGREKLDVLEDKLDALLSAGAGDVDMNELLADIRELISGAEDSILSGTSDQLADLKEDIESAISKAQTAIESAISEIRTSLDSYDAELEALSGKLDSLTGALSDLGESIGADIDEVLASIAEIKASIGTDDSAEIIAAIEELKAALADIDTAVGDISASVSTAVDVEEAKTNAAADLESWLNSYLDNIIKTSAARGTIVAYAAELTEDSELYGKLEEAFGKDNASLILKYYNDAMTSIENATSVSDVTSAVSTFKSQVASIEASTQNTPTLTAVYVLLAIILAVVIIVVIIMIVLMVTRKKKEADEEEPEEEPVAATETSEEAEKQPEEPVAEEQPEEPAAEEEVKEEAAEEPAEEAKAEQPEEELGDDRERVVITATVRTFDEAYEDLSEDLKDLFVRLKEYALTKEGTTEVKLSNGVCIKHGSRKVIRLTVRRGYPVAMFVLENEMLKDVRRNAASTLKLKIPATELVIRDETDFYAASTMIDFTMDQILKDIEEAKERRKAARRARRQQKREEEAGETGTAPAADAEDNAPTD